jgi:xylose isomerase
MDKKFGIADPMERYRAKADFAFELMDKLDLDYYCFHDADVAPEGKTVSREHCELPRRWSTTFTAPEEARQKVPVGHGNNFGDKKFMAGAATSCSADVFAVAAAKVAHASTRR